ncbi:Uma2 family endonuclease [Roseiarcus fermentans]|uniref:Uma2 family endonuclease n=1 Tax=Roseiarcus fermentans TaxID=1473586 RepID=A0A366FGU8_9HYPH|nr:Uma2 family endonuclease [Roseiarcus fermentans]RBP13827.1 Uma2 family endonuclease [Roseiarcus fermentans]
MTVNEFLAWIEGREGRWELFEGELVEKRPERPAHTETKRRTAAALKGAIRRVGAACHVTKDGSIVRISESTAFEPDAVIYSGERAERDTVEVPAPTVVVEVLSEGTEARDRGPKLAGYFSLPSVAHYLILDPEQRTVEHRWRGAGGRIEREALTDGPLRLDPPGLAFFVEELFAPV